jgi:hypothetical protein
MGTEPVTGDARLRRPEDPGIEPDSAGDECPLGFHVQGLDACAREVRAADAGDSEVVIAARRDRRSRKLRRGGQRAGEIELGVGERGESKRHISQVHV